MKKVENIIIYLALFSLWPWILGFRPWWYHLCLAAMLAILVWVTTRRVIRIRDVAKEQEGKK